MNFYIFLCGRLREAQGHRAIRFNPRHVASNMEAGDFRCYPLPMPAQSSSLLKSKQSIDFGCFLFTFERRLQTNPNGKKLSF
jgi:hypothetical protein